ncbi:hypothetical protein D3C81_1822920 [compost metagenome]
MQRHRIREIPDHGACLRITPWMHAVYLHRHTLDATGKIGLPVFAFRRFLLGFGQVVPPAEFLQQDVIELRIAGGDVGAQRM